MHRKNVRFILPKRCKCSQKRHLHNQRCIAFHSDDVAEHITGHTQWILMPDRRNTARTILPAKENADCPFMQMGSYRKQIRSCQRSCQRQVSELPELFLSLNRSCQKKEISIIWLVPIGEKSRLCKNNNKKPSKDRAKTEQRPSKKPSKNRAKTEHRRCIEKM